MHWLRLTNLIVLIHVLVGGTLVLFILLHAGRGGGLSDMFGGGMGGGRSGSSVVERTLGRFRVFDGLVLYADKTAAVTPGVATSWTPNADNTKFTFHLRSGTKFSNGEEVTSESFVRGMTRSLTPRFYNDPNGLGYHLDGVMGAA